MGYNGELRQFWVVFGLKVLGLENNFTGKSMWLGYTFIWNFLGFAILKILIMGVE